MLLEQTSKEFREIFLLEFIKEVIENTHSYQSLKIREEVKEFDKEKKERERKEAVNVPEQKQEIKEIVKEKIMEDSRKISDMYIKGLPLELEELSALPLPSPFQTKKTRINIPPVLRIPENRLPATVSYLRPTPTTEKIDVGKLNALVHDPLVKIIECNGPNENILVSGIMGRKPTAIKLSQEEIEEIFGKFAAASKIPVHEGLFKAALGNVVLSAVISEIAGIKFIIRKISREL